MDQNSNSQNRASDKDSREKLIRAAQSIFARRGFDGATVKELADEAGVNVSLVSYYFGGKEGLYRTCIQEAGQDRVNAANRILQEPASIEEFKLRFRLFVEEFINFNIVEQPELCTIIQRECDNENSLTRDIFRNTFLKGFDRLAEFFRKAQDKGFVRKEVQPILMASLIFGSLSNAVRFDQLGREFYGITLQDKDHRDAVIQHLVDFMLKGFM